MSQRHDAINRSVARSADCILEMLHDMGALVHTQRSVAPILRYLATAYNYKIDKLVIGSHPYPDFIVPTYGAAYAQTSSTQPTPTVSVIQDHFHHKDTRFIRDVGRCVTESWKTITGGYLWVNSVYALHTDTEDDVDTIRRVEATIEFIRALLVYQSETYNVAKIEILTFGRQAAYVASNLSRKLSYNHVKCVIIRCDQPAKFARITQNRDKVGQYKQYMCLTPTAIKFVEKMVSVYRSAQGIAESDIRYKMPGAIDSLISSGIKSISTDAQDLISHSPVYRKPSDNSSAEERFACLEQSLADMVVYNRKANDILCRLVEMISTNAFVSATIQDRVIGTVESATSSQTAPLARSTVRNTPVSNPMILQVSTSNVDDQSSISAPSITDLMTPIRRRTPEVPSSSGNNTQSGDGSGSVSDTSTIGDLPTPDLLNMLKRLPVHK